MTISIRRNSRLRFSEVALIGGVEFWDFDPLPELGVRNDDQYYQVKDGDRIDNLAQQFYGDPRLWWVIAVANDKELLPVQLNTGDKLRIPSPVFVQQSLFRGT